MRPSENLISAVEIISCKHLVAADTTGQAGGVMDNSTSSGHLMGDMMAAQSRLQALLYEFLSTSTNISSPTRLFSLLEASFKETVND